MVCIGDNPNDNTSNVYITTTTQIMITKNHSIYQKKMKYGTFYSAHFFLNSQRVITCIVNKMGTPTVGIRTHGIVVMVG
jgi:hypothetical protein